MKQSNSLPTAFDSEFLQALRFLRLNSSIPIGRGIGNRIGNRGGGGSIEFFEHRPYTPGDKPGDIDWKLYSRTRELFVKEFSPQEHLNVYILVDASRSMGFGNPAKIQRSKQVAALLGFIALASEDMLSVFTCSRAERSFVKGIKGVQRFQQVLDLLDKSPTKAQDTFNTDLTAIAQSASKHSHIFLISDFLMDYDIFSTLSRLKGRYIELTMIHVFDPSEATPTLTGPVLLNDSENSNHLRIHITERIRSEMSREFNDFVAELSKKATANAVTLHSFSTRSGLQDMLCRLIASGEIRTR